MQLMLFVKPEFIGLADQQDEESINIYELNANAAQKGNS